MGLAYLWDTQTSIYFLQSHFPPKAEAFIDDILLSNKPAISVITEIELLCWRSHSQKDLKILQSFIQHAWVFDLNDAVKKKTILLRRNHQLKLPDAMIAATAMVHGLTLLSFNDKDFDPIGSITNVNPMAV